MFEVNIKSVVIGFALLILNACTTAPIQLEVSEGVLFFEGGTNESSMKKLVETIESQPVEKLIISSIGGNSTYGVAIARMLREKNIEVVVDRYCYSSCANYILLGARKATVKSGAVVGFHGAPDSPCDSVAFKFGPVSRFLMSDQEIEDMLTVNTAKVRQDDAAFYSQVGFDGRLFSIAGHLPAYKGQVGNPLWNFAPQYYVDGGATHIIFEDSVPATVQADGSHLVTTIYPDIDVVRQQLSEKSDEICLP